MRRCLTSCFPAQSSFLQVSCRRCRIISPYRLLGYLFTRIAKAKSIQFEVLAIGFGIVEGIDVKFRKVSQATFLPMTRRRSKAKRFYRDLPTSLIFEDPSLYILKTQIGLYIFTKTRILCLLKGPVASLRIEEVSLGRTKGAKKLYDGLARAAASAKWRLPFMVRGVHIVLRIPSAQQKPHSRSSRAWTLPRLTSRLLAQTLLGLLPFIPIRVKDIEVVHEVGYPLFISDMQQCVSEILRT